MSPRAAALAVAAAWLVALAVYGPNADLARDDLCYLSTLHDFLLGYEARKDYGHLGWGVLHLLGHLDLAPAAWSAGRVGAVLALVATTTVPFCAWVGYRLTQAVLEDDAMARLAAALTAWSPAVLLGASTLGFWTRAGAVGLALLGVAALIDAMRSGSTRDAVAAVFLQGMGLALHPWALTGPAVALPLLGWMLWTRRERWPLVGAVLAVDAVILAAFLLLSGQGHRAEAGLNNLLPSLVFMPQAAAAHGLWQVPGLGRVMPLLPGTLAALLGLLAIAALVARSQTRAVGLLCLGGLVAALPEATAPFPPTHWFAAWSGNFIKACVGMEFAAIVAVAALLGSLITRWSGARRSLAVWTVLGICAVRGVVPMLDLAQTGRTDAAAGRTLGKALAGATSIDSPLTVVESLAPLGLASYRGKFNPEAAVASLAGKAGKSTNSSKGGPYAGVDLALWRTSTMRCELRLGLTAASLVPDNPAALHGSGCQRQPVVVPRAAPDNLCALAFSDGIPRFACPIGPPHAAARTTMDPAAVPLGLLGIALLTLGLAVSRRSARLR